jgi:hypothetical protein
MKDDKEIKVWGYTSKEAYNMLMKTCRTFYADRDLGRLEKGVLNQLVAYINSDGILKVVRCTSPGWRCISIAEPIRLDPCPVILDECWDVGEIDPYTCDWEPCHQDNPYCYGYSLDKSQTKYIAIDKMESFIETKEGFYFKLEYQYDDHWGEMLPEPEDISGLLDYFRFV